MSHTKQYKGRRTSSDIAKTKLNSALFGVAVTVVLGLSGSYGLKMKGTIHKLEDRVLELEDIVEEEESTPEKVLEKLKQDIAQADPVAEEP